MAFTDPYLANLYNLGQGIMGRFLLLSSANTVDNTLFAQAIATAKSLQNLKTLGTMRVWQGQLSRIVNALDTIVSLPSPLSSADLGRINVRYHGIAAFVGMLTRNMPNTPVSNLDNLQRGTPAVDAPDLVSLLCSTFFETPPLGLLSPQDIANEAVKMTAAWNNFVGSFPPTTLSSVGSGVSSAGMVALASNQTGEYFAASKITPALGQIPLTDLWNRMVASPSIAMLGDLALSRITDNDTQNFLVWKYRLRLAMNSLYALAASYRVRLLNSVQMGVVLQGDTIQQFATRESGDRANWQAITVLNNLRAPYITDAPVYFPVVSSSGNIIAGTYTLVVAKTGFTQGQVIRVTGAGENGSDLVATITAIAGNQLTLSAPAGITQYNAAVSSVTTRDRTLAAPGDRLFLPNLNGINNLSAAPDYNLNVLGADYYFGYFGQDMPPWTGDFSLIAGINNLSHSLGRRVLTTQGSLYFHPEYGSLLPPLVGNLATGATYGAAKRYFQAALLSDPRVQSISNLRISDYDAARSAMVVAADITPYGFTGSSSSLNLVLQPPSN